MQNIPIPGSSKPERVKDNAEAANITLTEEDLKGINDTLAKFELKGGKYPSYMDGMQVSCLYPAFPRMLTWLPDAIVCWLAFCLSLVPLLRVPHGLKCSTRHYEIPCGYVK
jgi:hypothetical protein